MTATSLKQPVKRCCGKKSQFQHPGFVAAARQYLRVLVGEATLDGVEFDAATHVRSNNHEHFKF
jgi:hypothetical protein